MHGTRENRIDKNRQRQLLWNHVLLYRRVYEDTVRHTQPPKANNAIANHCNTYEPAIMPCYTNYS
jgi:hypothetical protein